MILNVYRILEKTKVEGPGVRFCIWTQGCSRHCPGCYARETWDFEGGIPYDVEDIIEKILSLKDDIEGVTFLGGEPFEQAEALSKIAYACKLNNLSVICFSGNTYKELKEAKDKNYDRLLKYSDLLVDGSFIKEQFDLKRPLVGSCNQNYVFLTDRYNLQDILKIKNKFEVHIYEDGHLFINGMGDFKKIEKNLSLRKIRL